MTTATTSASPMLARTHMVRLVTTAPFVSRGQPSSMGTKGRSGSGPLQPLVEILPDRLHQRLDPGVEEVVGAGDHLLLDDDALLGLELVDQAGDVLVRHHRVLVAMDDQAGRRAGRQEREVIEV